MPEKKDLVINTGPLITIAAAFNDLRVLEFLYRKVLAPFRSLPGNIEAKGAAGFAFPQFKEAEWLHKWPTPLEISSIVLNSKRLAKIP